MNSHFKGSIVVITGGASGIGESIAKQLHDFGARIVIVDRTEVKTSEFTYIHADMTVLTDAKKVFENVIKEFGQIDYVFNCAGIFMAGEIRDTPIEHWRTVVDNNIWAVYNGTHLAYQAMLKQGNGHIINVASAAGLFPVPIMGIYGSSKFAIVGLSHALRNEAKALGVKVSVVCPTIVNTPLYDTAIYNRVNKSKVLKSRYKLQTPDVATERIIKGIVKNKATIHTAFSTKIGWWAYSFVPSLYGVFARRALTQYRNNLRTGIQ